MQNLVLSPIDPEELINGISQRVVEHILKDLKGFPSCTESANQILTVEEAARFLNLQPATIYSKVNRGELPVMKSGKRLYFSKSELLDHLKEGRIKPNSELEKEADSYLNNIKKG